jgi:hypothetical protein
LDSSTSARGCSYSYLTDNVWVLLLVGAALRAAPFVIRD